MTSWDATQHLSKPWSSWVFIVASFIAQWWTQRSAPLSLVEEHCGDSFTQPPLWWSAPLRSHQLLPHDSKRCFDHSWNPRGSRALFQEPHTWKPSYHIGTKDRPNDRYCSGNCKAFKCPASENSDECHNEYFLLSIMVSQLKSTLTSVQMKETLLFRNLLIAHEEIIIFKNDANEKRTLIIKSY